MQRSRNFGRTICARHSSRFFSSSSSSSASSCISFFFVFFLTDVLFVLQKAKRPGWSLSHCQPPHCVHVRCCQARQSEVMSSKRRRLRIARCERTPLAAGKKALNLPDRNDNNTLATLSTQSWGHTMHKDTRTQAEAA